MNSLLTKLMASRGFQDTTGVVRGLWRVLDAATSALSVQSSSRTAWNQYPTDTQKHQTPHPIQPIIFATPLQKTPTQPPKTQEQPPKVQMYKQQIQKVKEEGRINIHPTVEFKQEPLARNVPRTSTGRAYELSKLGVSLAGSAFSSYFKKKMGIIGQGQSYILNSENAKKITQTLCKMRGAPLKLAQALSIQEDKLIPKEIRQAFQRARDQAYIIPNSEVQYMMAKSFGADYKEQYFLKFSQKPFAASSIGQVHSGILKDGRKVAVKIQYPNVKESIDSDLSNIKMLINYTGLIPSTMFMDRIISNTRQELMEECDYVEQARKQKKYRHNMKGQQKYYVPQVIDELSSSDILTAEFITGVSMNALEEFPQEVRDQIGQRVLSLTFHELFVHNFMQTDPNPSNFFYDVDSDRLNLIDFGAARSYDQDFVDFYWQVIKGAVTDDEQLIWKASIKMGFVTGEENQAMKRAHIDSIKIVGQPFKFKGSFDFGNQDLTSRIYKTMPVMLKNRLKPPPSEVYSLHRKLSGSYLLCIRLKSRVNANLIFRQIDAVYKLKTQNTL